MVASSRRPSFLGTGWRFPLQLGPTGAIATASDELRIEESVYFILSTAKGERVTLPDFGCDIHDLVFDSDNVATRTIAVQTVREALVKFEPRIDVLDVDIESDTVTRNLLLVRVQYRIRANNAVGNLVYPFYLE